MSAQNILNNVQAIGTAGNFQVAPKIPKPTPQAVNYVNSVGSQLGAAYGTGMGPSTSTGGSALDKLIKAIRGQESNNNYSATNASGASGGYQILKSNFVNPGGWDQEALGRDVTYNEFMNSPAIQDTIARYKLGQYFNKYGAAGAAAAWYGGPGAVSHMYDKTPQPGGYPSFYAYIESVLGKM